MNPEDLNTLDLLDRLELLSDHQEAFAIINELKARFWSREGQTARCREALLATRQELQDIRLQLAHDMEMQT